MSRWVLDDLRDAVTATLETRERTLADLADGTPELPAAIDRLRAWPRDGVITIAFSSLDEPALAAFCDAAQAVCDELPLRLEFRDEDGNWRRWSQDHVRIRNIDQARTSRPYPHLLPSLIPMSIDS